MTNYFHMRRVGEICHHISCKKPGDYGVFNSRGARYGSYCHKHALVRVQELDRVFKDTPISDMPST